MWTLGPFSLPFTKTIMRWAQVGFAVVLIQPQVPHGESSQIQGMYVLLTLLNLMEVNVKLSVGPVFKSEQ